MSVSVSVSHAAALLGVSERTVWRRLREGRLRAVREGRRVRVVLDADDVGRRVAEALPVYGAQDPIAGAWPYSPQAIERQRDRLHQRRVAALTAMERLVAESRPDPDGLTSVDYLREWRDPDHDPGADP